MARDKKRNEGFVSKLVQDDIIMMIMNIKTETRCLNRVYFRGGTRVKTSSSTLDIGLICRLYHAVTCFCKDLTVVEPCSKTFT